MLHKVLLTLLVVPLAFLSSCVEGEEEIWINADASGRLVAHYEIPKIAMNQLGDPEKYLSALRSVDEKDDRIRITNLSFEVSRKAVFHIEAEFNDVRDLLTIAETHGEAFIEETDSDPESLNNIAGEIGFRFEGLSASFDRVVSPKEIFPEMVSDRPKMLGKSAFKYTIHFPTEVTDTNADSISEDRKSVSWTFTLKDHFETPMVMIASAKLPIPWWAWVVLAFLILLLAWLGRLIYRRFRAKSRSPQLDS